MDKWQNIWSGKSVEIDEDDRSNQEKVFLALKKASGYDLGPNMTFQAFLGEFNRMKELLHFKDNSENVYEVGAGPGGNLFLFQMEGVDAAGCDYAPSLVESGTRLGIKNLHVASAEDFPIMPQYDFVIAGGVFGYLGEEKKAILTLDRMVEKAKKSVCVKRVLNKEKEEELVAKRRATEPDYDIKYKDLSKLYLTKDFFNDYAKNKGLGCYIEDTQLEGYWNNEYTFDVYLYK
ncbi:MAG: class I SAM-dependent methyltransferase [Butyrivibrio sp.]|jgi:hypothetical protein|nr:class I SAM-dependent methyltransferase [Butyrivibrio sp.]MCR4636248.1 class I SAM-dependent methyltransferase [Butyrivibrio sp.]